MAGSGFAVPKLLDEADLLVLAPYLESHWPGAGSGVGVGDKGRKALMDCWRLRNPRQ